MNHLSELCGSNETKTFDSLRQFISKSSTIQSCSKILEKIMKNEYKSSYTRIYLSHLLFYFHASEILEEPVSIDPIIQELFPHHSSTFVIQLRLKQTCSLLYDSVHLHKEKEFINAFFDFKNAFEKWKTYDKQIIVKEYSQTYYTLENLSHQENELLFEKTEELKEKCKKQIKLLFPDTVFPPIHRSFHINTSLEKQVSLFVRKIFWTEMKEKMSQGDYSCVSELVAQIKKLLLSLHPKNCQEIEEKIDETFIQQMVEHDAFDLTQVESLMYYLIEKVKSVSAPIEDNSLQELSKTVEYFFKDKYSTNNEIEIGYFVCEIVREIIERLEKIIQTIVLMNESSV